MPSGLQCECSSIAENYVWENHHHFQYHHHHQCIKASRRHAKTCRGCGLRSAWIWRSAATLKSLTERGDNGMRTTMRCAHPQPDRATTLIRKPGCRHISHLHWHCARGLATQFAFWFCVTSMLACFYCATFVIARCRHAIANPTQSVCLTGSLSHSLTHQTFSPPIEVSHSMHINQ